jgi:hypothetical protein
MFVVDGRDCDMRWIDAISGLSAGVFEILG